jgi:hypothetical protein
MLTEYRRAASSEQLAQEESPAHRRVSGLVSANRPYSDNGLCKALGEFHLPLKPTPQAGIQREHPCLKWLQLSRATVFPFPLRLSVRGPTPKMENSRDRPL